MSVLDKIRSEEFSVIVLDETPETLKRNGKTAKLDRKATAELIKLAEIGEAALKGLKNTEPDDWINICPLDEPVDTCNSSELGTCQWKRFCEIRRELEESK